MGKTEVICDCCAVHEECLAYVKKEMVSDSELSKVSNLYKIFGDSTRLNIMAALNCHDMCVCDLAVLMNMTKSAISHQLKVLRDNNLVKFEKKGKHSYYSLSDKHVEDILNIALEHINE